MAPAPPAAGQAKAKPLVKLPKAVIDRVKQLNASGLLKKELRIGLVATRLVELGQEDALDVLDGVIEDPSGCEDPVNWIREAADAIMDDRANFDTNDYEYPCGGPEDFGPPGEDVMGTLSGGGAVDSAKEGFEELILAELACKEPSSKPPLHEEVAAKAEVMLRQGSLHLRMDPDKLGSLVAIMGELPGLEVLADLEKSDAKGETEQYAFFVSAAGKLLESMRGTTFAIRLSRRARWCSENLGFPQPMNLGKVALALAPLGEVAALLVLRRLTRCVADGDNLADPTQWIIDIARRVTLGTANTALDDGAFGGGMRAPGLGTPEGGPGTPPGTPEEAAPSTPTWCMR